MMRLSSITTERAKGFIAPWTVSVRFDGKLQPASSLAQDKPSA